MWVLHLLCLMICVSSVWLEEVCDDPYLSNKVLGECLKNMTERHSNLAKLHSIGQSVSGRNIWALEVTEGVGDRPLLRPMFKYVANIHGDETVGRELVYRLASYLLENYDKDNEVTSLLKTTDIFLVPSLNPDGFANSKVSIISKMYSYHVTHFQNCNNLAVADLLLLTGLNAAR